MDMDLAGRVGVEWVSKFCPVKGSTCHEGHGALTLDGVTKVGHVEYESIRIYGTNIVRTIPTFVSFRSPVIGNKLLVVSYVLR